MRGRKDQKVVKQEFLIKNIVLMYQMPVPFCCYRIVINLVLHKACKEALQNMPEANFQPK